MAVRKAETIYLGDASSVVKAAAAAQKANEAYAAKTKASATEIVAAQDRVTLAGKKAADAAIKAGDSQARAATLAGRAAMDQAKAVGASTTQQVSAYRKASEAAIASSEKASAAQKAASDKQMAAAKASAAGTLGFVKKAGEGFLAMGAASVYAAVKFQKNMELMHTQAGASTAEVTRMSKAVLNLGLSTEQGPNALVKALYPLESVGLRGATALAALTAASKGAAVGQADLTETTHALAGVMVALHESGGQAAAQMGAIDAVVGVGKMTMQDFVDALKSGIVPTARAVGLSFQSMAAGLATLTDAGVPAEMAATKMRTILLMLAHEHTTAAVDGLKAVGLTADQLAGAMRAPGNGLLNVLTLLHDHMQNLSKVKQVDLLSNLAGGSRSAGTLITLIQNMDRVGNKYKQIGQLTGQFNSRVAAESETASHKIKVAWSIIQTAAIEMGQKLLPVVSSVLGSIEKFVQEMAKGQGAGGQFRDGVVSAFNTVKSVVVPVFNGIKTVISAVVGALGGLKSVLPAAVAGFLAFRAVGAVVGIFGGIKAAIAGMTNPVTLAAVGVGALVTAMMLLKDHEENEAQAAKAVADAKRKEAEAIQAAQDAALGAADAQFNSIHAAQDLKDATNAATDARKRYGANSPQYRSALLAEREASLRNVEAQHQQAQSTKDLTDKNRAAVDAAKKREQEDIKGVAASIKWGIQNDNTAGALRKARGYVLDYVKAQAALTGSTATAALQQFQLQRLMAGGDLITNKNVTSVAKLVAIFGRVPKSVQTKLLADPQDALAKIGNLVGRLKGVVSLRTIAKILADSSDAKQAISQLTALLGGLPQLGRNAGAGMGQEIAAGINATVGIVDSALNGVIGSLSGILGNTVLPGPKIGAPHKALGGGVAGFASGGLFQFGQRGPQGPDDIPVNFGGNRIMVGSGEIGMVANPRQQAFLNARTADVGGLAGVFQKFARGGFAGGGVATGTGGGFIAMVARAVQSLLYPLDAALTSLNAQSTALQAKFAAQDQVAQSRSLHGALIGARNERGPNRSHDINAALDAIKQFNTQASRAKQLAAIDLKIKGIQQLKDFSDAITGLRTNMHDLATQAAQSWRTKMETAINAAHDAAVKAAQGVHDSAIAAIASGPESAQLKALQATDAAAQDAQQTQQLNDALSGANQGVTDAQTLVDHSGGQTHIDALKALADAQQKVKDAQDAIDAYQRSKDEAALQQKIADQTKAADDAQTTAQQTADDNQATALAGLDQEQADFQTALDNKLQAETDSLAARKENYAKWAADVNGILAQYGLVAAVDGNTEITVDAGPGSTPAKPTVTTGGHGHGHGHHHRAMGGPVLAGVAYTVGETGPETYVPDRSGVILTAAQTRQGGRSGATVHIDKFVSYNERSVKTFADRLAFQTHVGSQ